MKSMLQEGSTIAQAIEKAWEAVGKPQEFSIKVLQAEETSFFGFIQNRPAVVSISYDPTQRGNFAARRPNPRDQQQSNHHNNGNNGKRAQNSSRDRNNRDQRDSKESPFKPYQPKEERAPREQQQREPRKEQQPRSVEPRKEHPGWSEQFAGEIVTDLRAILNDMAIATPFRHAIQKQQLVVTFDAPLFEEADLEKMFYASLAHLLLQLMKRRHRQAFSGYRLLLTNNSLSNQPAESRESENAA